MIGCQKVREARSLLIAGFVVKLFYSHVLDLAVHVFDLDIGPWMVGQGLTVFVALP